MSPDVPPTSTRCSRSVALGFQGQGTADGSAHFPEGVWLCTLTLRNRWFPRVSLFRVGHWRAPSRSI